MRTLVITIDDAAGPQQDYPIALFVDDGQAHWQAQPVAVATIPRELTVPDPPRDPEDQQPLAVARLREIILTVSDQSDKFMVVGEYLYQLLAQGEVGKQWQQLRARAAREGTGLRTVLDIRPQAVRLLPFELLCHEQEYLFINPQSPFMRGEIDFTQAAPQYDPPLTALVVVGAGLDDKTIKVEEELTAIRLAFRKLRHKIDLEILFNPSSAYEFNERYRRICPHILHFIGHGDKDGQGKPLLKFEKWDWRVPDIIASLRGQAPRFAFINACRSAELDIQRLNWSIADAFIKAGTVAVLGMQGDVRGDASALFARVIYDEIALGTSLDAAVAEARRQVSQACRLDQRDWALATLSLTVKPADVLPLAIKLDTNKEAQLQTVPQFARIMEFVDREEQRDQLWKGVDPPRQPDAYRSLLVVMGEEEVGKSSLVYWCLERCAMRGRNLLYVDLKDGKTKSFIDILRIIRDADPYASSLIRKPLDYTAFHRFNFDLHYWLNGERPPDFDPQSRLVRDDNVKRWDGGDKQTVEAIFLAFFAALERAAGHEPLIIVLDHLRDNDLLPGHFNDYLWPYMIKPIAERKLPQVRIILCVNSSDHKRFNLDRLVSSESTIAVPLFKACDFEKLALEYLSNYEINVQYVKKVIAAINEISTGEDWKPERLSQLKGAINISRPRRP